MQKVQKRTARKIYNTGGVVWLQACRMRQGNIWTGDGYPIRNGDGDEFDKIINNFEYYNCDAERGKYTSFYIK